ncbi:hypothetical protein Tco_0684930, partial [Tanacetum coccineum]
EFEEEEEDDMEVDIEEDENESELTYPYEEVDPLNPPPPTFESEPDNEIKVEDAVESEDETIPASVHEVGESSIVPFLHEDSDSLLPSLMRRDINSLFGRMASLSRRLCGREKAHALVEKKGKAKDKYYGKLILDLGNEVRSSVEQRTAAMEGLVEKIGNVEEKAECKKLTKELEEPRGFMFVERPNEAINVPIEDEKSPLSEPIIPLKSAPMTQAATRRLIKESVDAAIAAERESQAKVRNDASGSGPVRGQDTAPVVRECTFAGFMKCNPTVFCEIEGVIELRRWFEKTESVFGINDCAEGKKVRFPAATLEGPALTWWNSKIATLGLETVNRMPWTKIEQLGNPMCRNLVITYTSLLVHESNSKGDENMRKNSREKLERESEWLNSNKCVKYKMRTNTLSTLGEGYLYLYSLSWMPSFSNTGQARVLVGLKPDTRNQLDYINEPDYPFLVYYNIS